MKTLNIMDLQFNYKAVLRGYESAVLTRAWAGIGSLDLVVSAGITNAELIQIDDLLWFDNEYHKAFIVEKVELQLAGNEVKYHIVATSINTLIRDFITIPPALSAYDVRTGTREAVVRAWVDANCISPADSARAQYPIMLGASQSLGETITDQTRYGNLAEEITRVLQAEDLGWRLELDIPGSRFVFKVLKGVNRTAGQTINGRVLFGLKYGNMAGFRSVEDTTAAKTVVYAGGQGEGEARQIVKLDGSGPGRKKEAFVDARDADTPDKLNERAAQAVAEGAPINSFEFEVLDRQFRYGQEYDLGDYVTVVMDRASTIDMQIQGVTETYDKGSIQVVPEFGKPERTLGGVIGSVIKRVSKLETV